MKLHVYLFATMLSLTGLVSGQSGVAKAPAPSFRLTPIRVEYGTLSPDQQKTLAEVAGRTLTARVIQSPGDPQPIIVIYNDDGGCRVCIGKAEKCLAACPAPKGTTKTQSLANH